MNRAIVKVSQAGEIYWDGKPMAPEAMPDALAQLKAAGGCVVYYREAPNEDPSPESLSAFQKIVDAAVPVQLGSEAEPEWGRLEWVEIEEAPHRFRFALIP